MTGVASQFCYDECDRLPHLLEGLQESLGSVPAGSPPGTPRTKHQRNRNRFDQADVSDKGDRNGGAGSGGGFALSALFLEDKEKRHHQNLLADSRADMQRYSSSLRDRLAALEAEEEEQLIGASVDKDGNNTLATRLADRHHSSPKSTASSLKGRARVVAERAVEEEAIDRKSEGIGLRMAALEARRRRT